MPLSNITCVQTEKKEQINHLFKETDASDALAGLTARTRWPSLIRCAALRLCLLIKEKL